MKTGDRVRVYIQNPEEWANGSVQKIDGKIGAIKEIKSTGEILVEFDTPPEKWWSNQVPGRCWWFSEQDLFPCFGGKR